MTLPDPNPVDVPWHRLYQFWEAYDKEYTNLLKKWHNDTAQLRRPPPPPRPGEPKRDPWPIPSGNVLYDSFLDTWGEGNFEDESVGLDEKSYFAALATASVEPRAECLKVLQHILEIDEDGVPLDPPQLKVPVEEANAKAEAARGKLLTRFSTDFDALKNKVDPNVRNAIGGSDDRYLKALLRMMDIETECFRVQRDFLKTGTITEPEEERIA
jgi:hypothetical protein